MPRWEIGMRYECDLKVTLKGLEICTAVFGWIFKQQSNLLLFLSDWHCGTGKKMIFISLKGIRVEIEIIAANFQ